MNSVNVQASINNLAQMDRQQQYLHRTPVVNQEQNAEISRQEAARRVEAPVQPDPAEGKNIDPEARRRESGRPKPRKRGKEPDTRPKADSPNSSFIDVTA